MLTKFQNVDQISKFYQIQNVDQLSKFWPNFKISTFSKKSRVFFKVYFCEMYPTCVFIFIVKISFVTVLAYINVYFHKTLPLKIHLIHLWKQYLAVVGQYSQQFYRQAFGWWMVWTSSPWLQLGKAFALRRTPAEASFTLSRPPEAELAADCLGLCCNVIGSTGDLKINF